MSTTGTNRTPTPSVGPSNTRREDHDAKVGKPDMYHGKREGLDDWLNQLDLFFLFNGTPNNRKTLMATTYMRGRAQHWIKPKLRTFLDDGTDTGTIFSNYSMFKVEIRRIFGTSNESIVAARAVQTLRQETAASDYASKFQEYAPVTGWDDAALCTMYRRGLKETVKDELMRYGGDVDTLNALIEASIELDDKLYERSLEKRRFGGNSFRAGTWPGGKTRGGRRTTAAAYGDPMELDSIQPKKSFQPKKKGQAKGKCFTCGKEGHYARNCRSRNTVNRREFNMVIKKEVLEESSQSDDPQEIQGEELEVWQYLEDHEESGVTQEEERLAEGMRAILINTARPIQYSLRGWGLEKRDFDDHLRVVLDDVYHADHQWLPTCPWFRCVLHPEKALYPSLHGHRTTIAEYFHYWENLACDDRDINHINSIGAEQCRVENCQWVPHQRYHREKQEARKFQVQWDRVHSSQDHDGHREYTPPCECKDADCTIDTHVEYRQERKQSEEQGLVWEHPEHHEHGTLAWSHCYYDNCHIHASAKGNNGYYPRKDSGKGRRSRGRMGSGALIMPSEEEVADRSALGQW